MSFKSPNINQYDAPFWGWNGRLEPSRLASQIECFKKMGFGGFFMHPRTGMQTPYLSEEFFAAVDASVKAAKANGMKAWLYDEDRWPSGTVSGTLTKNPKYCGRGIAVSFTPPPPKELLNDGNYEIFATYFVRLDDKGFLLDYKRCALEDDAPSEFKKLYCYRRLYPKSNFFNGERYVDILNAEATRAFIEATHEKYATRFSDEFGKTIPGIFTDEPQMRYHDLPFSAFDISLASYPFTEGFFDEYSRKYQEDFWATFPELVWDLADGSPSPCRYKYMKMLEEMVAENFFRPISEWCKAHNLIFTGHLMSEQTLASQSNYYGECMPHYRFFDIPGIDMLADQTEYSTVKQVVSVARQEGKRDVVSELDGVTDWDFPFYAHKTHGDWQAALGVTMRVPHLSWYSMEGEAKRDYPTPLGPQAPWHESYPLLADHFARLNTVLRRGKAVCNVAVIHPVESSWLLRGPQSTSGMKLEQLENDFQQITSWLCQSLIDFDYISEGLLPNQATSVENGVLHVGEASYNIIIIPPLLTLRSSTLQLLEDFQNNGGKLLFVGSVPKLCDAAPSICPEQLATTVLPFSKAALLEQIDSPIRIVEKFSQQPATALLAQMRQDGDERCLFICDSRRVGSAFNAQVAIQGRWHISTMDTATGEISPMTAEITATETRFECEFQPGTHLLLNMTPANLTSASLAGEKEASHACEFRINGNSLPISLDEPNVLVLDFAEWRLDDGAWNPPEEIYRLNTILRKRLALPEWQARGRQTWTMPTPKENHQLQYRFTFTSETTLCNAKLAVEHPDASSFALDGVPMLINDCGFWTDESIRTLALPELPSGKHTLSITTQYNENTILERLFILGDFNVALNGTKAVLQPPRRILHWGDLTTQGLPFYGGNVTYHASFSINEPMELHIAFPRQIPQNPKCLNAPLAQKYDDGISFKGILLGVSVDDAPMQKVAFPPFILKLGEMEAGAHRIDITLFGHRYNCFGAFHRIDRIAINPACWFPKDEFFSKEYQLAPFGIIAAPLILHAF